MGCELNASVLVARSPIYGGMRAAAVGGVLGSLARRPFRRGISWLRIMNASVPTIDTWLHLFWLS